MGIFKKLFGTPEPVSDKDNTVKKSLYNFFKISLVELPDDRFVEGETELNSQGDSFQNYRASLDYLECDIFDTVEILKFQNGSMNIFLKYYDLSNVNIDKVKKLINSLYLIYGVDDREKGKFTNKDLEYFYSEETYQLFGRRWHSVNSNNPIEIGIDRESNVITFSIWSVKPKQKLS
jgi:hypothetical protein